MQRPRGGRTGMGWAQPACVRPCGSRYALREESGRVSTRFARSFLPLQSTLKVGLKLAGASVDSVLKVLTLAWSTTNSAGPTCFR